MKFLLIFLLALAGLSNNATCQNQMFFGNKNVSVSYDSDAQAFFTAAGITDGTQKTAVNTLVLGLKSNSLWTKMIAIYPFVGGTASTHKYNLKDPRDLDAAYRLTFGGTVSHGSSGADPNGSTGYANTYIVPSVVFSDVLNHVSVYITESPTAADMQEIGVRGANNEEMGMQTRISGNLFYPVIGGGSFPNASNSTAGYFIANKQTSGNTEGYKNGTEVVDGAQSSGALPNTNSIFLFCMVGNFASTTRHSDRNTAFVTIGTTLTEAQAATLNTLVEAYQDALSRGVQ